MSLTLVAFSLDEQPLTQPITALFDARGGTIGRADHNTMALPDPQRHISRLQAEVLVTGDSYRVRNVGANPIIHGSRRLGPGEVCALSEGDVVRVGGYQLKATMGPDEPVAPPADGIERVRPPASQAPPAARPVPAARPPAPAPLPTNDLLSGVPGVSDSNPFADLLGPGAATAPPTLQREPGQTFADLMPPVQGIEARSAAVAPAPSPAPRLPDDFDPFAPRAAPPVAGAGSPWASASASAPASASASPSASAPPLAPVAPRAAAAGDNPFADLFPSSPAPSMDDAFGLAGVGGGGDPLAEFLSGGAAAGPATGTRPERDLLGEFGLGPQPAAEAPAMPQWDQLPAVRAQFTPPRAARPPEPPAPMPMPAPARAPVPAPSGATRSSDALWRAFCDGAGLASEDVVSAASEESMRRLGRIMISAVAGALQLMAVRGSTKHEFRADVTVIQQHDNNPLKFTPDAATALEQLLRPPLRGFLDGPAAMDDAMFDLVGHSIGTVAGLRAAVEGMLARFAPEALERKLVGGSVLDSLLPMARKARLWELYLQHHESIREEAQEDFHALFGKAFLAAYSQQVERLKREARR